MPQCGPVSDPDDNFFTQAAGVTADMNVLILIRFKYSYQHIQRIDFIFALISPGVDDGLQAFIRCGPNRALRFPCPFPGMK